MLDFTAFMIGCCAATGSHQMQTSFHVYRCPPPRKQSHCNLQAVWCVISMEDSVGPLGNILDHYWDPSKKRYFKGKLPVRRPHSLAHGSVSAPAINSHPQAGMIAV